MHNKIFISLAALLSLPALAANNCCCSKITMQYSAENWLSSTSSLISVTVNATIPAASADEVSNSISKKLNKISQAANWRITSVNRDESDSGLIKLQANAESRIQNNQIGLFQKKLQSLNIPGEQYKIANIDNHPELAEINQALAKLRKDLLQQIQIGQKELNETLNNSDKTYTLYRVKFKLPTNNNQRPVAFVSRAKTTDNNVTKIANKLEMQADVTYAVCN